MEKKRQMRIMLVNRYRPTNDEVSALIAHYPNTEFTFVSTEPTDGADHLESCSSLNPDFVLIPETSIFEEAITKKIRHVALSKTGLYDLTLTLCRGKNIPV